MRSLFVEVLAIIVISIVIVSAALGTLPGNCGSVFAECAPGDATWLHKTLHFIVTAATLRFGDSTLARGPVINAIGDAAIRSVAIILSTALLLLLIGVPLGVVSATRSTSRVVRGVRRTISIISSSPVLVWSTLIFVLAARSKFALILREDDHLAAALCAAVAALVIGDHILSDISQRVQLSAVEIMNEPYMRTVRAADLGFRRHLLQSLVRPVAEAVAARSMFLIGGAIVAEKVFEIHGLGYTVVNALNNSEQEPNLILAASLALVAIGLFFRIVHRGAVAIADPRHRG